MKLLAVAALAACGGPARPIANTTDRPPAPREVEVAGVVTDAATGDAIPGVTVAALHVLRDSTWTEELPTTMTGDDGRYRLAGLPAGTYIMHFYFVHITVERTVEVQGKVAVDQELDQRWVGREAKICTGTAAATCK